MTKVTAEEKDKALDMLRRFLKPGDTVYTILRHVSKSGMTRDISCYAMTPNGPQWLDGYIAAAGLFRRTPGYRDALRVGGCGMDMGFHIVYTLSRVLFHGNFSCLGKDNRCPSNDHSNDYILKTPEALRYSPDREHSDGGYALRHQWL